jgi:hypothetical protein
VGGGVAAAATEKCMCWNIMRTRILWEIDSTPPQITKIPVCQWDTAGRAWEKRETVWIPVIWKMISCCNKSAAIIVRML